MFSAYIVLADMFSIKLAITVKLIIKLTTSVSAARNLSGNKLLYEVNVVAMLHSVTMFQSNVHQQSILSRAASVTKGVDGECQAFIGY